MEETDLSKFKIGLGALTALLVAFGAFGLAGSVPTAQADIVSVWLVDGTPASVPDAGDPPAYCGDLDGAEPVTAGTTWSTNISTTSPAVTRGFWICVVLDANQGNDGTDSADVTFDSNDQGRFIRAICYNNDNDGDAFENGNPPGGDACISIEGLNTDELIVDCSEQPGTPVPCSTDVPVPDEGGILVFWECPTTAVLTQITISTSDEDAGNDSFAFNVRCRAFAGGATLTARPTTVEIVPAPSNTAHSLIELTVTDSSGNPILIAPSTDVDFTTDRCGVEEAGVDDASELASARAAISALSTAIPSTYVAWDALANSLASPDTTPSSDNTSVYDFDTIGSGLGLRSMAAVILHCDPHAGITNATPGVATITACLEVPDAADICRTTTVTVIGPPASITVAASPTTLRCGEKSQITVTVKDAIGQNVSDHTIVEMVTNLGGTIGGTGGVLSFVGPVVPVSSNGAGTFGGVATAFLLTSESHSGPYEVVATTGGTLPGVGISGNIGIFSTPPIAAQVTVTCTIPAAVAPTAAATVTAPRTGTGITPPSTGDGGLADSSSSWTLFAIGGLAAFAIAGLAGLKFARR
jgi:hypothetical protein